jgi:hypothetical protein
MRIDIYELVEDSRGKIRAQSSSVSISELGKVSSVIPILDEYGNPTEFVELSNGSVIKQDDLHKVFEV